MFFSKSFHSIPVLLIGMYKKGLWKICLKDAYIAVITP